MENETIREHPVPKTPAFSLINEWTEFDSRFVGEQIHLITIGFHAWGIVFVIFGIGTQIDFRFRK